MGKIIELTHDDVQNELAYALICETMEGAYWNSGRRRRMFSKSSVSNPTFFHSVLRYLTTIPQLPLNPIPSGSVQAIRFALSLM